jgi:hypothetical protein
MWHSRTAAPVVAIVILIPECGVLQICYFYYARVYENVRLYSSFKTEIKCVILTLVSSNKWLIVTVILFHSTVNAVPRIYSSTLTNIRYVRNFCKRCRKILSSVGFVLRSPTAVQQMMTRLTENLSIPTTTGSPILLSNIDAKDIRQAKSWPTSSLVGYVNREEV